MTIWYTNEVNPDSSEALTAGVKARTDLSSILESFGYKPLSVLTSGVDREHAGKVEKISAHRKLEQNWLNALDVLEEDDVVIIQFPNIEHTIFFGRVLKRCKDRGIKTCLFIHDLESLRSSLRSDIGFATKWRYRFEEENPLNLCDFIVAHNDSMIQTLAENKGISRSKMYSLVIFDYLISKDIDIDQSRFALDEPIVVIGTLRPHKAGYAYNLPSTLRFNLYGRDYGGKTNESICYFGAMESDELARNVSGSFGLVWDGDETLTCSGVFGQYLRVNNPHKVSCYLAMGLPVIIWEKAALAPFVLNEGVGISVSSIEDIPQAVSNLSQEDYRSMLIRTLELSKRLRSGWYTKQVLSKFL